MTAVPKPKQDKSISRSPPDAQGFTTGADTTGLIVCYWLSRPTAAGYLIIHWGKVQLGTYLGHGVNGEGPIRNLSWSRS